MKKYYELVKLHKLKFGLTEFFVLLAAAIYIVGYPLLASAASTTCERQTLSYGTVRTGGYGIGLSGTGDKSDDKSLPARNVSGTGLSNSTDVDVNRSVMIKEGSYVQGAVQDGEPTTGISPAGSAVNGTSLYMAMTNGTGTPVAAVGYQETELEFASSPVRNLTFSVLDIEQNMQFKEVAKVSVYESGSNTPISDISQYGVIDNNSVDYTGSNVYKANASTVSSGNGAITQGNIAFDLGNKLISKVVITYTFESLDGSPFSGSAGMILKDVSFDGPCIGLAVNATAIGDTVTLDYTISNIGGLPLTAITLPEDLDAIFGAGNYTLVSAPALVAGEQTIVANGAFLGAGSSDILKPSSELQLYKSSIVRLVVKVKNPAVGGDGKGNYSSTEQVSGRPIASTAYLVTDDSVSGTKVDVSGDGSAADDMGPWVVNLSSVNSVPGAPKTGATGASLKPLQLAGLILLAPLTYLNRGRLFAKFKK